MVLVALLAAGAVTYTAFPARILECDAVIYASRAGHAGLSEVLSASHLGFDFTDYMAARLGRHLSTPASAIHILTPASVAIGLAGVFFFWLLLCRLGASAATNLLLSGTLMFCYTYWHFSLQAESHIIAGFFLILLAWQVHRLYRKPKVGNAVLASLFLALATLMHQTSVLVMPAILAGVVLLRAPREKKRSTVLALITSCAAIIAVPYLAGGISAAGSVSAAGLWEWATTSHLQASWGNWRVTSVPAAAVGLARSLIGSHYVLGFGPVERLANRLFPLGSFADEMTVAGLVGKHIRYVLVPLHAALLIFFGAAVLGCLRGLRSVLAARHPYAAFLVVYILTLTVFVIWWAPERAEFYIAIIIPGLILLGLPGVSRLISGIRMPVAALLVAALFAMNFAGSIRPQSARSAEPEACVAVAIDAVVDKGDIVLSDSDFRGRAAVYVQSFEKVNLLESAAPARGRDTIVEAVGRVDSLLEAADRDGRSVYAVLSPLSRGPHSREAYSEIVSALQEEFLITEPVQIRAPALLGRVESRKR
jgi:hypothetical protein